MPSGSVLATVQALECELHDPRVRRSRERLVALLHPQFREFSRAGAEYSREQIIEHLLSESHPRAVHAQGFAILDLAPTLVLLTYQSAYISSSGQLERHANRSSIWRLESSGWQMIFHQGTPAEPFSD